MKFVMDTGYAIKVGRAAMGLTVKELAEKSGVAQPTISRIENGGNCKFFTAHKILQSLDRVAFDWKESEVVVTIKR